MLAEKKIEMVMAEPLVSPHGVKTVVKDAGNEIRSAARDVVHTAEMAASILQTSAMPFHFQNYCMRMAPHILACELHR